MQTQDTPFDIHLLRYLSCDLILWIYSYAAVEIEYYLSTIFEPDLPIDRQLKH